MRHPLNDIRAWTVIIIGVTAVGAVRVLDDALPLPERVGVWDPLTPPPSSDLSGGPLPDVELASLASQGSVAELVDLRPLAGRALQATTVAGQELLLPTGMMTLLEQGVGRDAIDRALVQARAAVRDPEDLVGATPGLDADIHARIAAGLGSELSTWGQRLAAGPAVGHHHRVLIQGIGRDAAWHLPDALAPHVEARTYGAWLDLAEAWYQQHDVPVERFSLDLPLDPLRPGYFDMEAWVAAWATGSAPEADPFAALGRLQAIHLLARAGLIELLFAGHGRQVLDPLDRQDRFGAYRLGSLQVGDACEELAILRQRRGGLSVRYGLCMPAGEALVSLSCSIVSDGSSGPQHSSAALAWFLEHGSWPAFLAIEPTAFRLFPKLQARQLAASSPDDLRRAAVDTVADGRALLGNAAVTGDLAALGPGAWRLRVGTSAEPDLVLLDASVDRVDDDLAERITLATTTWRVARPSASGTRRLAEYVDICGAPDGCADVVGLLARVRGPLPTQAQDASLVELDGFQTELVAVPDHTNSWVRLAVLRGASEDRGAFLERAWRLRRGITGRRVLGLHLVEG